MDNALRIKRVKEGIKLLEKGHDPAEYWQFMSSDLQEYIGTSKEGNSILYMNGYPWICEEIESHGFIGRTETNEITGEDKKVLLHNWKRFLELIENIK
jgi:hypothetical protein